MGALAESFKLVRFLKYSTYWQWGSKNVESDEASSLVEHIAGQGALDEML